MSDEEDPESKTEEPTEKKLNDARERGNTPVSRDVPVVVGFVSFLVCLTLVFGNVAGRLTEAFVLIFENVGEIDFRVAGDATLLLSSLAGETAWFLGPTLGVIMMGGLLAAFIQGVPQIAVDRITPDLSRISIRSGWKRVFGLQGLIELLKTLLKVGIVATAIAIVLMMDQGAITDALKFEPRILPGLALKVMVHLVAIVCVVGGILAGGDLIWSRFKWHRDLRMARQEVKEEIKQAEGDAFVKARMRSLAQSRARRRMMANVPRASVVLANPTHFAIALRYVREEGGAPVVVAKGKDLLALKIREIASLHDIPVLERRELVRAMFDHVDIDKMIPTEFYRPIAEIIHFLGQARKSSDRR